MGGAEPVTLRLRNVTSLDESIGPQPHTNANCIVRKLLFLKLVAQYESFLANFVASFTFEDFIYRELAFVILSLAAGEFSLLKTVDLLADGSWSGTISDNSTLFKPGAFSLSHVNILSPYRPPDNSAVLSKVDVREDARFSHLRHRSHATTSKEPERAYDVGTYCCIPCFGYGAHKRLAAPGFAPTHGTTFWLNNVVIPLFRDPRNSRASGTQAPQLRTTITEIVKFAWPPDPANRSNAAFYSIVFSQARVVLLRIEPAAGAPTAGGGASGTSSGADAAFAVVQHTDALPLLALQPLGLGDSAANPHAEAIFAAMARLFDAAFSLTHTRTAAANNAGVLPDEILQRVVDFADWRMRRRAFLRTPPFLLRTPLFSQMAPPGM
jgi:hypothetical protein